jgi:ABC-type glycerol-3-phosphate transport system substrate-binding protein
MNGTDHRHTGMTRRGALKTLLAASASVPAAAALLESCGGGQSGGGNVELTLWTHTHPPMIKLMKTLIAEYEKKHPNVHVKYQQIPNDQFATKMLTSLSSGAGPDIINMDDGGLRGDYIPKHLIVPVDAKALGYGSVGDLKGKYIGGAFAGATGSDGKIYGLPLEYDAEIFGYNAAQFKQAGLDPAKPPTTWDEVGTMGKALVQAQGGRMTRQGFDFIMLHSGWYMDAIELLLHQTGGHIINQSGAKSTIGQPNAVKALSIWNDLITKDKVGDPHIASSNATVPYIDFYTGKLSMTVLGGPWAWAQMKQSYAQNAGDMRLGVIPQVDPSNSYSRAYGYYMAVNHVSKQQSEAWKFIGYVTSQHDRWLSDVQFVQPVKGWQNGAAAKKMDFIDAWTKTYATAKFDEVGPNWTQISDIVARAIQDTILNGVAPSQSFAKAQGEIDQALAK